MTAAPLRRLAWLAALAAAPSPAAAQSDTVPGPAASRTAGPPVQRITTASALSTERLGSITGVRELPDGRVLVNDGARRRLLVMDTAMSVVGVVLDSLAEVSNTYGTRAGVLIPFRGDTTLFVDPVSYAIVVLDPAARIARVRSVWRVQDVPWLTNPGGSYGWPGVDARGRVVYRIPAQAERPRAAPPSGVPYFPPEPDSAFVVAVDLDTRMLDTLGTMRIPKSVSTVRRTGEGRFTVDQVINPLPGTDEWAVLPDGAVAFVRGRDYRIDYLNPDGGWTSSPKLPFEWQRLTDEDKQRLVDSVKTAQERTTAAVYVSSMIRWANQYRRPYPPGFTIPAGFVVPPGFSRGWTLPPGLAFPAGYIYACEPGEEARVTPVPGAAAAFPGTPPGGAPPGMPSCIPAPVTLGGGATPPPPAMRQVRVVPASELPDYRPPFAAGGTVRADADGNLWIRTLPARPVPGGPVYDVVSRQGEMVSRMQLPPGYTLVGFGRGKVVYLSMRDASGIHLARVRLR